MILSIEELRKIIKFCDHGTYRSPYLGSWSIAGTDIVSVLEDCVNELETFHRETERLIRIAPEVISDILYEEFIGIADEADWINFANLDRAMERINAIFGKGNKYPPDDGRVPEG